MKSQIEKIKKISATSDANLGVILDGRFSKSEDNVSKDGASKDTGDETLSRFFVNRTFDARHVGMI